MKNSLMVPVVFLANLMIWSALAAFFSVLSSSSSVLFLSSGKYVPIFIELLWNAVKFLPFSFLVALLFTQVYLIRHKTLFFVSVPVFLCLTFASVAWAMPLSYTALQRLGGAHADVKRLEGFLDETAPFIGHIQPVGNAARIVWLSESEGGRSVLPLVVVRPKASDEDSVTALTIFPSARFSAKNGTVLADSPPGSFTIQGGDYLAEGYYDTPKFVTAAIDGISSVLDAFSASRARGEADYLAVVGSFAFAVLALAFVGKATGWRLLNLFFSWFLFASFFIVYRLTCSGPFFDLMMRFLPSSIPARFFSPLLYAAFALAVSLAGSLVGLWRVAHRPKYPLVDGAYNE